MAQQVQLHNKYFWICTVSTAIFMLSCRHNQPVVPSVFVNISQPFKTQQGITSLNNKLFSGWQFGLYATGDTALLVPYYNGKENGIVKSWYANRQLSEVRIYTDGKKTGVHKAWWPDDKPKFEYHFVNDVYEGSVKEWNAAGLLYKEFQYKNGQENGLQRQYFSDGSLQFNYEAKNGRNYGWTGVKNCVNIKDSIEKTN